MDTSTSIYNFNYPAILSVGGHFYQYIYNINYPAILSVDGHFYQYI